MAAIAEKLKVGLEAVSLASKITRKIQNSLCEEDILTKTDSSPVTIADFAAQTIVNSTLSKRLPKPVSMVSEEEGANLTDDKTLESVMKFIKNTLDISNHSQLKAAIDFGKNKEKPEKFWTLDPIDGTKGFIRGQQYAISLAYVEEKEIQLGILGCPNLNPDLSRNPENINKKDHFFSQPKIMALGALISTILIVILNVFGLVQSYPSNSLNFANQLKPLIRGIT